MLDNKLKVENLMNLVMQFRKVCNHPELFERRTVKSPYFMKQNQYQKDIKMNGLNQMKEIYRNTRSPIVFDLPKLVFDEVLLECGKESLISRRFNVFSAQNMSVDNATFSFSRFTGVGHREFELVRCKGELITACVMLHALKSMNRRHKVYKNGNHKRVELKSSMLWVSRALTEGYIKQNSLYVRRLESMHELLTYAPEKVVFLTQLCFYLSAVVSGLPRLNCPSKA